MNDRRFKELLNLHLDHRLTPGEAEELERALRDDPARRRMLSAYSAMQHGCAVVCRRSSAGAPASASLLRAIRDAERKVHAPAVDRSVWRDWANWGAMGGLAAAVFAIAVVRMNAPDGAQITVASVQGSDVIAETGAAIVAQMREAAPALASQQGLVASPSRQSSLSPHLTLAALGIPGENSPEVGVVSRWSYPLDDLTEQEVQRAVAWARHANNTEWNIAGGSQGLSRFSSAGTTEGFQAGQVSFTPNR